MKLFTKRPQLTRREAFGSTPVINTQVKVQHLQEGDIMLSYPLGPRPWIAALARRMGKDISKTPHFKKLQLDELGSAVWMLIDGKRTVKNIAVKFAQMHQLGRQEAEAAVARFLYDLGKRGIIGME